MKNRDTEEWVYCKECGKHIDPGMWGYHVNKHRIEKIEQKIKEKKENEKC